MFLCLGFSWVPFCKQMETLVGSATINVDLYDFLSNDPASIFLVKAFVSPKDSKGLWKNRIYSDEADIEMVAEVLTFTPGPVQRKVTPAVLEFPDKVTEELLQSKIPWASAEMLGASAF